LACATRRRGRERRWAKHQNSHQRFIDKRKQLSISQQKLPQPGQTAAQQ